MSGITERVIVPVSGDVENWKMQLKALLQALKEQPGYVRTRWGPWSEDMQKLDLLVGKKSFPPAKNRARVCVRVSEGAAALTATAPRPGWESKEACDAWNNTASFKECTEGFKPVLTGKPQAYFIKFVPYAPKEVIDSSIVEVLTFADSTGPEDELRAAVEKAKSLEGCNGVASGYSTDAVDGGKVFVAIIGWASEDVSKAADKSAYAAGKPEVHHVNFRFPVKGFRGL